MKITKSQLREIIREMIVLESNNPIDIFNRGKELAISIKNGIAVKDAHSKLKKLEADYKRAAAPIEIKKVKELTNLLSKKLSSIAYVQQYNGVFILIDLKDEYRHKFKNSRELLDFIHKIMGDRIFMMANFNVGNTRKATSALLSLTDRYAEKNGFPRWIELSRWELK